MVRIFQALDAYGEHKVLLLAISELEFVPNVGEELEINGNAFVVLKIKHVLATATMVQDLELTVIPPHLLVEVDYVEEEGYDY